jgi:hypothetical protein
MPAGTEIQSLAHRAIRRARIDGWYRMPASTHCANWSASTRLPWRIPAREFRECEYFVPEFSR